MWLDLSRTVTREGMHINAWATPQRETSESHSKPPEANATGAGSLPGAVRPGSPRSHDTQQRRVVTGGRAGTRSDTIPGQKKDNVRGN